MRIAIELRRIVQSATAAARRRRSAGAVKRRWTLLLPVALLVTAPSLAGSSDLRIARDPSGVGLILPGGLWLSGDVTLAVDVPEHQPATGEIDDVSLLARYEPLDRLALFGELRLEDIVEVVEGEGVQTGSTETGSAEVLVERLYAETLLAPQLSARLGKVYTPFGLWNVITRAPLTWTVDRPAVTEDVFPERATGLSLLYQTTWQGWSLDATAYGPAQDEISFRRTEDTDTGLLFGTRLAGGRDLGPAYAALGLNSAGFRSRDQADWTTATGLDLEVSVGGHEITGEFTYRVPTTGGTEHGLYLQDAIPLLGQLYGVLRFEYFQPPKGRPAVGQLVGLFWRPVPNLVLKADYLFGTRQLENFQPGFQASVSLLF
jgi:hypothetical protein